jgi:hypothetical protein
MAGLAGLLFAADGAYGLLLVRKPKREVRGKKPIAIETS